MKKNGKEKDDTLKEYIAKSYFTEEWLGLSFFFTSSIARKCIIFYLCHREKVAYTQSNVGIFGLCRAPRSGVARL